MILCRREEINAGRKKRLNGKIKGTSNSGNKPTNEKVFTGNFNTIYQAQLFAN